jgi:LPS export ABC transporter protein LptC/lipopolysaccharide transport protein LptA
MARKPRIFIATLRKLLLLALVLTVVAVVGLFWFGRSGREPRRAVEEEEARRTRQGTTLIGEDFDYTFTEREKPIFRIRGESVRADEKGVVYLNGVGVTIYDKQGRPYHVESRKASFQRETNEGLLQGQVFLRGPEGLELRTARLDLKRKGQLLVAPRDPVEIRYGGKYVVTSNRLEVDLPRDEYRLQGRVRLRTVPGAPGEPASLIAQRLVYERPQRWLRVEGDSELRHGSDWLKARRITAKLTPDETGLHFVRALWGVTGETRATAADPAGGGGAQPTTVRFRGRDLAAVLRPEGDEVRRMDLEAGNQGKALIESTGGGLTRTMRAKRFEGLLAQGVLTSAHAFGGVEIREVARGRGAEGMREAEGRRAEAAFLPDGQLTAVELIGDVLYRDPQVNAAGNRGSLDLEAGRGEFMGNPVTITSERGRVQAPRVVYNTDTQIVQARGGVRAVLERVSETALAGSPLGEGQGPVMVESQEAFWKQEPSSFIFRGDVRAWRGENLLLAPELRGDRTQETLVATGGVKTRWLPDSDVSLAAKPAAEKPQAGSVQPSRAPIEVAAGEMTYRQGSGVLNYVGNVRVNQQAKTLTCQNLQVELEEAGAKEDEREVETMTCTGDAKLNDPQAGRKVEGQKAVYHVAERRVEMTGDPVTMLDREGNVLRGRRLFYFIDDGKVEMKGASAQAPAPAAAGGGR